MIEFKNVSKVYDNNTVALKDFNLSISSGEFVFVVGASGAGKSTFLKLIMCEEEPTSGTIIVNGQDLSNIRKKDIPYLRRTMGIVFQDFRIIENKNVYENVAFAMHVLGTPKKEIAKRVPYILELVGLQNMAKRMPNQISGGELQRLGIARALVNNPQMIVADEPTGNLDPAFSLEIMMLLDRINALGTTVLVVTHEKELVNRFGKRVLAIEEGRIISDRTGGYYFNETINDRGAADPGSGNRAADGDGKNLPGEQFQQEQQGKENSESREKADGEKSGEANGKAEATPGPSEA